MSVEPMTEQTSQPIIQKDSTIWSSRRACQIAVRITYQMKEEKGCKIYQLKQVEELEKSAA